MAKRDEGIIVRLTRVCNYMEAKVVWAEEARIGAEQRYRALRTTQDYFENALSSLVAVEEVDKNLSAQIVEAEKEMKRDGY